MSEIRTRVYKAGALEAENFPVADVSNYLEEDDTIVWVDYHDPSKSDLAEVADELGLHELAVEDALGPHQRPKIDRYESHLFMSCHAVTMDRDTGELEATEIDAFINERWLVTVRKHDGTSMDSVIDRWDRSPALMSNGVSFLLYGLLDVVVDGYFDAVEAFDEFFDEVSDGIFSEEPIEPADQRHWFLMRRSLVRFHRLVGPTREVVSGLMRRENSGAPESVYPYYQDVYDHILRVSESTDALRDLVATIVETNLSIRDYRQNQVMKKVTSWAAIIAVPTLITGFYGMNVPYPGFANHSGLYLSAVLIVVLSAALYISFKKRDWL